MRLIRDGEKGEGGIEVGEEGEREKLYTYHYTVTTRMTSALRWAAMRAILMFHNCEGQSQYPQTTTFQVKGEQKQIRTEVPLLTSLTARETAWGVGVPEVMRQRQGGKVEARQTSFLSQTHR